MVTVDSQLDVKDQSVITPTIYEMNAIRQKMTKAKSQF